MSRAAKRPGIFPTFFMSGFECSTFLWKDRGRRDLAVETQHRERAAEDYELLRGLGIAVSREGVPWPLVERGGAYDFSALDPVIDAMNRARILPIWDLCHYGYPDDADPFAPDFAERFARYCRAAAAHVTERMTVRPHCFTPINEITFWGFCGGEWGWVAPFGKDRETRHRFRLALCGAAIAAVRAIREVDPDARMVHVEPVIQVVPPRDRPDLADEARHEARDDACFAWDVLAGKRHPELGGSPEILDVVGANCYSFGQMEYRAHGPHMAMAPRDERIRPLCDMLRDVWERYRRPMIIGETSGLGDGRPAWLNDVMEESLAAVAGGIDLHGVCLYPAVDMPDWHTGQWLHNGLCDVVEEGGALRRVPFAPYVDALRDWQRRLNKDLTLDDDPFSDPVELQDVVDAAHRLRTTPDKDWS